MTGAGQRLIAALAAGVLALAPFAARSETLADALADAYRNSNLLEQNRSLLRVAGEDVSQAEAALRPTLNFIASAGYAEPALADSLSASVALSAQMTLYDFGRNRLAVDAAQENVLATRAALLGLEQRVLMGAVVAYTDVVSAEEFVRLREANVRLIGEQLRAARDRFEVGEITRTEVAIAESRLAAAQASLAVAEGTEDIAREQFKVAVGRAPGQLAGVGSAPAVPASLDEARATAVRGHPTLRQAQHEVRVAELNAERASRASRGQLSGDANVGMDQNGTGGASVGLTFRQPIYQGGALKSLGRQAAAAQEAARSGLLQRRLEVERDVAVAWAQLEVARAQIEASELQVRAASVAFQGVQEEARLGARTTLDVLDAEQELLDARTARVDAAAGQVVAVYQLLAAMGLLTVEHLGLGVPVYDPEAYYGATRNAPAQSEQGERLDRILRGLEHE